MFEIKIKILIKVLAECFYYTKIVRLFQFLRTISLCVLKPSYVLPSTEFGYPDKSGNPIRLLGGCPICTNLNNIHTFAVSFSSFFFLPGNISSSSCTCALLFQKVSGPARNHRSTYTKMPFPCSCFFLCPAGFLRENR